MEPFYYRRAAAVFPHKTMPYVGFLIDTPNVGVTSLLMLNLKLRLHQRGMSVRELAAELGVPLKTVQDGFYRGAVPSPTNQQKLDEFLPCPHHWVIDAANGHTSRGVCQLCQETREFENSTYGTAWQLPTRGAGGRPM